MHLETTFNPERVCERGPQDISIYECILTGGHWGFWLVLTSMTSGQET